MRSSRRRRAAKTPPDETIFLPKQRAHNTRSCWTSYVLTGNWACRTRASTSASAALPIKPQAGHHLPVACSFPSAHHPMRFPAEKCKQTQKPLSCEEKSKFDFGRLWVGTRAEEENRRALPSDAHLLLRNTDGAARVATCAASASAGMPAARREPCPEASMLVV